MNKQDQTKRAALEKLEKQVRFCVKEWADKEKELSKEILQNELTICKERFSQEEYAEIESNINQIKESLGRFIMFCRNRDIKLINSRQEPL